jgi:hypothetical protein
VPKRLEAVELVPHRFARPVRGLAREPPARRMNGFALPLEHACDRILRQPLNLKLRRDRTQLTGDREVTVDVAEADRRGNEQSAAAAAASGASTENPRRAQVETDPPDGPVADALAHRSAPCRYFARRVGCSPDDAIRIVNMFFILACFLADPASGLQR